MESASLNKKDINEISDQGFAQQAQNSFENTSLRNGKKDRLKAWIQEFERAIKQINAGVL